jgi:hypothetical protein
MGISNDLVTADAIDATGFPEMADPYQYVMPRTGYRSWNGQSADVAHGSGCLVDSSGVAVAKARRPDVSGAATTQ